MKMSMSSFSAKRGDFAELIEKDAGKRE